MKRFKKVVNSALAFTVAAFTLAGAFSVEVQAEEVLEYTETTDAAGEQNSDGEQEPADLQVMQSIVSDTIVKAFIKNPSVLGVSDYQIGNVKCEDLEQHGNSQDAYPMRTLILLDNSESIPTNMRDTVKEYIKKIIECHAEGERFRLATFSDTIQYLQDDYSDDYTALSNVVEAIEYHDQDTYLTDVLYELLKELNANDYKGYVRLVVISDGVDNKEIGITKLERDESFKSRNYPVYTVGIDTGKNSSMLSEMFALSRTTGAGYLVLEKDKAEEAAQTVIGDNEITVMQAHIPDKLQNGSEMNSLITFSNGQTLEFYVKMPFGEEPEEIIIEASVYESVEEIAMPIEEDDGWLSWDNKTLIMAVIAGILVFVIVIVLIILSLVKKKKKGTEMAPVPTENLDASGGATELFAFGSGSQNNGTEQLTPSISDGRKKYMFLLTDNDDEDRTFRCELIDEITIGRMEDNHIIIGDDNSVHRHHSVVSVKNGAFYYMDLKDTKNRSSVNGVLLKPTIPQLIVTNSVLTIGRHSYTISISEGR